METEKAINIVGTRCKPELDDKFNKWYDEIHIPMLLKFKGLQGVTRYKIAKDNEKYPYYLAIYEFESPQAVEEYNSSPELAAALEESREIWNDGDWEMLWRVSLFSENSSSSRLFLRTFSSSGRPESSSMSWYKVIMSGRTKASGSLGERKSLPFSVNSTSCPLSSMA